MRKPYIYILGGTAIALLLIGVWRGAPEAAVAPETSVSALAPAGQSSPVQQEIRKAVESGELMPLPEILELAQTYVSGEIVKVEIEQKPWGIQYEVKILTADGHIREVELNARTGELIEIEDD